MQQKDDGGCGAVLSLLFILGFFGYLLYQVVKFLTSPGALQSILEFFKAVLMCTGLGLLALVLIGLWARFTPVRPHVKLKQQSREYVVCCYAYEMEGSPGGYLSPELPEIPGQERVNPIYLVAQITNQGLRTSPFSAVSTLAWLPGENAERYLQLSGGRSQPVIIGVGCFQLFYLTYRREGSQAWEQTPPSQAGSSGPLPAPGADQGIKIVLIYNALTLESDLESSIPRSRPLKLKIEVINLDGAPDKKATRELYNGLLKLVNSIAPEDDDSWMYHSRPIYW